MSEDIKETKYVSAAELLDKLFSEILVTEDFDAEIVQLTQQHLGVASPHSKAGTNLAAALVNLAMRRAEEK
jgi:hypothetical protein